MSPQEDNGNAMSSAIEASFSKGQPMEVHDGLSDGQPVLSVISGDGEDRRGDDDAFFLRWSRLTKTVEVKEANSGLLRGSIAAPSDKTKKAIRKVGSITKTILTETSGCAEPGQVMALMGPSGSGKTSLLNILSGRSSYNSGVISINGDVVDGSKMKRLMSKVAYVKQQDIFFQHLTIRDQLTYTALLRMPSSMTKAQKMEEVENVLRNLRLTSVAESAIMMLSGGEKKRVNIGTELLTDPKVLLLDEPTSGLDSTSAVGLIRLLQDMARQQNKTVITSIHQPSSSVFRSFDKLMLLAEGNMVYFGTPTGSLSYLREKGFPCPDGYNAADHLMDLLVVDSVLEKEVEDKEDLNGHTNAFGDGSVVLNDHGQETNLRRRVGGGRRSSTVPARLQLIQAWDREAVAEQMDAALNSDDQSVKSDKREKTKKSKMTKYNTTWWTQFVVLTHRSLKNSRSAIFTPLNLVKSVALGVVAGLLWWQTPNTEKYVADRSAYYFFTMTFWVFDSMFNSLMAFPIERDVILKERASAAYRVSAYFLAKTVSEAPTRLALPFLYMIPSFWMAGLNPRFSVFVGSTVCTLLSCLAGESIGLFIGAWIYDMQKGMTVLTVFSLFLMLLGGFFVQNIPSFLIWARYVSPFKYAFDASRQLVFDRNVPCDGSGALEELCGGSSEGYATPEQVIDFLQVDGGVAFNVSLLLVVCFVPRYLAYLALRAKKAGDRE
mmetsp:Transcript_41161/g.60945  ORF Transcript_41161/g.60945 Transcript_41161/m.60945 type:complete len:718 (-) Transcript_41161:45-2198(-)|eukprot:CAMPEP_0194047422 /NCGR_PEP_ID=MMETSP0009_2-20130614/24594_1 /TAXON_ID=210454 /ORGANISM="Grammatophora oceanica, Strain CCMP 410" /LENGTH=717 /DNA_ID=CAMNT_0038693045 /DNA_START=16 /DNA_END=2169 /DNA_ORIENTATION=+